MASSMASTSTTIQPTPRWRTAVFGFPRAAFNFAIFTSYQLSAISYQLQLLTARSTCRQADSSYSQRAVEEVLQDTKRTLAEVLEQQRHDRPATFFEREFRGQELRHVIVGAIPGGGKLFLPLR